MGVITSDCIQDRRHDALGFHENFVVPEAKHSESTFKQPRVTSGIACGFQMLAAVDFDDQSLVQANEVGDKGADGMLTSKSRSFDLMKAQVLPEPPFRFGHFRAQTPRQLPFCTLTHKSAPILPFPRTRGKE